MTVKKDIHSIILFHRKKAELSRKELADLAGVGKTVVYDVEKGKTTVKWKTLVKILTALNIEIKLESPLMGIYVSSKDS